MAYRQEILDRVHLNYNATEGQEKYAAVFEAYKDRELRLIDADDDDFEDFVDEVEENVKNMLNNSYTSEEIMNEYDAIFLGGANLSFSLNAANRLEEELDRRGLAAKVDRLKEKEPSSAVQDILSALDEINPDKFFEKGIF